MSRLSRCECKSSYGLREHADRNQRHEIRQSLRGDAVVLMGKNTMVRRAIKGFIADNPEYERLLPHVKGKHSQKVIK